MSNFELDHVVVFASVDGPEARAVEAAGLQGYGGVTQHGSLGTASTSFFFANVRYLELFWVHDPGAAKHHLDPLSLNVGDRMAWRATGAAPFGLMLRRRQAGSTEPAPFPCHALSADWMPPGTIVEFNGETAGEPYYGVVPEALSFRGYRANIPDLPHPLGVKELTGVSVGLTAADRSAIARLLEQDGLARFETGAEMLLTLTFDGGARGQAVDLQPALPVRLAY